MQCTLDFLRYDASNGDLYTTGTDGLLTTELGLMERYATSHPNVYWCDVQRRPELLCLDVASASTLSDSLDDSHSGDVANSMLIYNVQDTANASSTELFGSRDTCHGRRVGDGIIDVFDISTVLSYLFGDWMYSTLSPNPTLVRTVHGREGAALLCLSLIHI